LTDPRTVGFDPQKLEVPLGTSRKKLPVGDDRALFLLSQGRCYAPGCAVPAFQKVDRHYKPLLRRAHICAHDPGGPRFDRTMSQEDRDSWTNMLLLCDEHHGRVDSVEDLADYPVALLRQWKSDREQGLVGDLPQLRGISDLDLQQLLLQHVEGMLDSIDNLEGISRAGIAEIKSVLEHQFVGSALDAHAVDMFFDAVMTLRHMSLPDDVAHLNMVIDDLKGMAFSECVTVLHRVAVDLKMLYDLDFYSLRHLSSDLDRSADRLSGEVESLNEGTDSLMNANAQVAQTLAGGQQQDRNEDVRRFWPYIAKTFLVGWVLGAAGVGGLWALSAWVI
jgi:hypothetical protein